MNKEIGNQDLGELWLSDSNWNWLSFSHIDKTNPSSRKIDHGLMPTHICRTVTAVLESLLCPCVCRVSVRPSEGTPHGTAAALRLSFLVCQYSCILVDKRKLFFWRKFFFHAISFPKTVHGLHYKMLVIPLRLEKQACPCSVVFSVRPRKLLALFSPQYFAARLYPFRVFCLHITTNWLRFSGNGLCWLHDVLSEKFVPVRHSSWRTIPNLLLSIDLVADVSGNQCAAPSQIFRPCQSSCLVEFVGVTTVVPGTPLYYQGPLLTALHCWLGDPPPSCKRMTAWTWRWEGILFFQF